MYLDFSFLSTQKYSFQITMDNEYWDVFIKLLNAYLNFNTLDIKITDFDLKSFGNCSFQYIRNAHNILNNTNPNTSELFSQVDKIVPFYDLLKTFRDFLTKKETNEELTYNTYTNVSNLLYNEETEDYDILCDIVSEKDKDFDEIFWTPEINEFLFDSEGYELSMIDLYDGELRIINGMVFFSMSSYLYSFLLYIFYDISHEQYGAPIYQPILLSLINYFNEIRFKSIQRTFFSIIKNICNQSNLRFIGEMYATFMRVIPSNKYLYTLNSNGFHIVKNAYNNNYSVQDVSFNKDTKKFIITHICRMIMENQMTPDNLFCKNIPFESVEFYNLCYFPEILQYPIKYTDRTGFWKILENNLCELYVNKESKTIRIHEFYSDLWSEWYLDFDITIHPNINLILLDVWLSFYILNKTIRDHIFQQIIQSLELF